MDTDRQQCARIFETWHELARTRDVDGLLALYATNATFESPLVPAILDDVVSGVLFGHEGIRRFSPRGPGAAPMSSSAGIGQATTCVTAARCFGSTPAPRRTAIRSTSRR